MKNTKHKLLSIFCLLVVSSHVFAHVNHYDANGNYVGRSDESNITILPQTESAGGKMGRSFGEGLAEGLEKALSLKAAKKKQINLTRQKVRAILLNYTTEQHQKYMKRLASSPDLSGSLKSDLLSTYNSYYKKRIAIDLQLNQELKMLAKQIVAEEDGSAKDIIKITMYTNPYISQTELNTKVDSLHLSKPNKKKVQALIKLYYKERKSIDKWCSEKEEVLISNLER